MRIDAHVHGDISKLTVSPADYAAQCRKRGVERVVLIANPEPTLEAYKALPDFVIPVPWVDIDKVTAKDVHDHIDAGALGIKFIDPQFSYGDTRYDPLYRAISERGKVAMFHTGYLGLGVFQKSRPTDITFMRPAAVDSLARRHRDLKILMAHFGNPWWEEAWKITWSNPKVHAELSGGTAYRRSLLMWRETFAPNGELDVETFSKILYASDVRVFGEPGKEGFEPYFAFYDKLFDAVGAPDDLREKVNRGNALELFGLE
jgi:predicted TIM-barrel fold metal-dependent hydrolase